MPIRLIDPTQPTTIEVEGCVVKVKTLTTGQVKQLSLRIVDVKSTDFDELMRLIAEFVIEFDGDTDPASIREKLPRIANIESQMAILHAVTQRLTEREQKNLNCSSDGSAAQQPTSAKDMESTAQQAVDVGCTPEP